MRPEGNEAGESSLNPPAPDQARRVFHIRLPPDARRSLDPRSGLDRPQQGPGGLTMDCYATAPRLAAEPVQHPIESVIAAAGQRRRGTLPDLTPILVRYWQELPQFTVDERARWLHATRARVRS